MRNCIYAHSSAKDLLLAVRSIEREEEKITSALREAEESMLLSQEEVQSLVKSMQACYNEIAVAIGSIILRDAEVITKSHENN